MVEEILPNLYRIEIPIPGNPLKAINSYLVKGPKRFLLIDTGMNRVECMQKMSASLGRLSVDLNMTDFFITHFHADHLGLVDSLATKTSTVYMNQVEASIINAKRVQKEARWKRIYAIHLENGFPADELTRSIETHPGRRYGLKHSVNFSILKEGDTIDIGDYSFRCIETPGHSPGHMCLYEANKRILVAGDHILTDITPNITFWLEMENSLKEYLASLDKVYILEVDLVLPGHRSTLNDHRTRIKELCEHHRSRLREILSALGDGDKTPFQIVPYITWDIDYSSWELFPATQKWFAFGETLAHLKYLEKEGAIRSLMKQNKVLFSLT